MAFTLSSLGSGAEEETQDLREFNKYQVYAGLAFNSYSQNVPNNMTLTGSSTTFTVPTGVTKVRITTVGAGGAGGTRNGGNYYGGGGGGGAAFATGEYTVTPGEVLTIAVGQNANRTTSSGQQYNGGTSQVTDQATGGTKINISANGGTGGQGYSYGNGGSTKSASGSNLISGTTFLADGGRGGQGSTQAFGFGPEPYNAGGGGAAGFVLGNGGRGGDTNNGGGYSTFSCGGGAVGGKQGGDWPFGASSTSNQQYAAAAGGGANQQAAPNGLNSNTPVAGGVGYTGTPGSYQSFNNQNSSDVHGNEKGVNAKGVYPTTISVSGVSNFLADVTTTGGTVTEISYGEKSFAWDVLAVAFQAGGGGGSGYSSYPYNYHGGDAGPGGGGGGGGCYNQNSWGSRASDSYYVFDYTKGCWRLTDVGYEYEPLRYNARGGHGGILGGGGGGGGYYGDGGGAGFGGGGGGGGGHYNSGQHGYGGPAGPGFVLIEWTE